MKYFTSPSGPALMLIALLFLFSSGCTRHIQNIRHNAMAEFEMNTGLHKVNVPDTSKEYYGKNYRGYQVLFHGEAGDVWGRYAARLAIGELSREAGGIVAYLGGGMEWSNGVAGSHFDKLLADCIGQPINITVLIRHGKPAAPRLDIVVSSSEIKPNEKMPEVGDLGFGNGVVYSNQRQFAKKILTNKQLVARLKRFRHYYIRVDGLAVSFLWAGQEVDFSAMIRDHENYAGMINSIIDSLADIADTLPEA